MRYLALTERDREEMLKELDLTSASDVYNEIPSSLIKKDNFKLPKHQTELAVETNLKIWLIKISIPTSFLVL